MSLLLRTRHVNINGCTARVYSVDGKTWVSKARDALAWRKRYSQERRELQRVFAEIDTSTGERTIKYQQSHLKRIRDDSRYLSSQNYLSQVPDIYPITILHVLSYQPIFAIAISALIRKQTHVRKCTIYQLNHRFTCQSLVITIFLISSFLPQRTIAQPIYI